MPLTEEQAAQILALIQAEEPSETEDPGEVAPPEKVGENATIRSIRAEAKRAEARAKQAESELAELREFRETTVAKMKADTLASAGLSPKQAEVYLKANEDISPEAVAAFKAEVLGIGEPTTDGEPFRPTGFAGESPDKQLSVKEFEAEYRKDPDAARKLALEGKVAFRTE
jgi:hypothetical protein